MPAYLYYRNVFRTASHTSVTANHENSDYPAANIEDMNKHTLAKPNTTDAWIITIDMAESGLSITDMLINNTNASTEVEGAGEGVKLYTEDTDDNGWDDTMEYHVGSSGAYHQATASDSPIWWETFTASTRRYWRLAVSGHSTSFYLGGMLLTDEFASSTVESLPRQKAHSYGLLETHTPGGIVHTGQRYGLKRGWIMKWDHTSSTYRDNMVDTFWAEIEGGHRPFVLKDEDGSLFWVRATQGGRLKQTEDQFKWWSFTVSMEEEL